MAGPVFMLYLNRKGVMFMGAVLTMQSIKNYIDGQWVEAGGEPFESTNPADRREVVGLVGRSSKADVDRAVAAARAAYNSWRLTPAPKRGEILFRAAEMLL